MRSGECVCVCVSCVASEWRVRLLCLSFKSKNLLFPLLLLSFIFCILLFASTSATARDVHHNIVKLYFRCVLNTVYLPHAVRRHRIRTYQKWLHSEKQAIVVFLRVNWWGTTTTTSSATMLTTYVCADNETIEMSSKFCDTFHHQLTHRTAMEMVSCAQGISVELILKMRRTKIDPIFSSSSFHSFIPFIYLYLYAQSAFSDDIDWRQPMRAANCAWDE